jgi:hypothetical protein
MNKDELFLHQQRLLARSSELRLNLIHTAQAFKKPLAAADRTHASLQWLYNNPLWPTSALLMLMLLRPRRAISWGSRAWWAWKTFSRVKKWIDTQRLQGISAK